MARYNVEIESRVTFSTEVEANDENEARLKAMDEWGECDPSEMEFWNTHVTDVWEDDE